MASYHRQTQTVILAKTRFKTVEDALAWVRERGYMDIPDETSTSYRFRQRDPDFFKKNSFSSLKVAEGVTIVSALPKTRKER